MQAALIIFVKNPIPGKTKTRLAEDVGNDAALAMYGQLMDHTRRQALKLTGIERLLYYSDFIPDHDMWSMGGFERRVQSGEDLGQRMLSAFEEVFKEGAERVVIIGSDCPGVDSDLLVEAFAHLKDNDLVLGPALDGGYYLLGMKQPQPTLFQDMNWSTETVAKETRKRAKNEGLSLFKLPTLSDVDYLEDWLNYGWDLPG
ncbi:MAG: TIGR04282 family arsenosugar biosynthesis glycosyltransferase [Bacteroidota bacterium]